MCVKTNVATWRVKDEPGALLTAAMLTSPACHGWRATRVRKPLNGFEHLTTTR
jgi:hypothetical protein